MKFAKCSISFLAVLLLVGVSATPSAAQAGQGWRDAPWQFEAKVYGWLPKAPVTIKIDQQEVANMPETLDNILDSLEMTAMFELEAHKGPLGLFVSPVYYKGKATEHFTGLAGVDRKVTLEESVWAIDYGVAYEIGQWHLGGVCRFPYCDRGAVCGGALLTR